MKLETIIGAAVFAVIFGAVAGSFGGEHIASYLRWHEMNHRGYIRCVNGHMNIGNFDLEGDFKHPVFDFDHDPCAE